VDDITKNMSAVKQTNILIMDFSKAFDKFSHSLLLHKLEHHGAGSFLLYTSLLF
jgi:hypothetical protein